jgi:hypothetical protein
VAEARRRHLRIGLECLAYGLVILLIAVILEKVAVRGASGADEWPMLDDALARKDFMIRGAQYMIDAIDVLIATAGGLIAGIAYVFTRALGRDTVVSAATLRLLIFFLSFAISTIYLGVAGQIFLARKTIEATLVAGDAYLFVTFQAGFLLLAAIFAGVVLYRLLRAGDEGAARI